MDIDHNNLKPWRTDPEAATKFTMDEDGNLVATFESRADAELACRLAAAERIQMDHPELVVNGFVRHWTTDLWFKIENQFGHLIGNPQKTPAEAWISAEQSQRKEGA